MQQKTESYYGDARQTGRQMRWIVKHFYMDMAPYATLTHQEIFDKVKKLPFRPDPKNIELLKRPKFTMEQFGPGGDCDDKSICIASWAKLNNIPWDFIAVGRRKGDSWKIPLTHVFVRLYYLNNALNVDATYSTNVIGLTSGVHYDREVII